MLLNLFKKLTGWLFNRQLVLDALIGGHHKQMQGDTKALVASIFESYELNGELTYAEISKFGRLDKLVKEIDAVTGVGYENIYNGLYEALSDNYKEHYAQSAYDIETTAKKKGLYSMKERTIHAMILNPIDGLTLSDRLEKRRSNTVFDIKREIVRGLENGETYHKVSKRLNNVFDNDKVKSLRVARTEMHRVSERAKLNAAMDSHNSGIFMEKIWKSGKDERVRNTASASHVKLDGTVVEIDKLFKQGDGQGMCPGSMNSASHDINCRCALAYRVNTNKTVQEKDYKKPSLKAFIKNLKGVT